MPGPGRDHIVILTNLPLEEVGAWELCEIYKQRWTIELFFRWLKCLLPCRHWLVESEDGIATQVYCALIAALLLSQREGKLPTKRLMEMLIVKAVPGILEGQSLPAECVGHDSFWPDRHQDIMRHEDFLHRNGTRVLKFFLHLSKDEQRKRLLARTEEPDKNWKISPADLKSRAQWDDFQQVYAECLDQTSHPTAPWYSIPADNKRNARLIISHIVVETLKSLPIEYPKPDGKQLAEVEKVRRVLSEEGDG